MQPARESRQRCRIAAEFDGRLHLVEQPYDAEFTAWFGSVELEVAADRWEELAWQDIEFDLEDGRSGEAYVISRCNSQNAAPGASLILYFVGVTKLSGPAGNH